MNLFFLSTLYLHFQVWQYKREVKRSQMCRKYKQKWWLSINLQRNRTRFISLKQVYRPNSRLVIHTVHLKYRRAKFRMSRNWILILKKNKEIREMICLSGNFCSHSFFFACNVKLEWRRLLSFCEKNDHTHSIVSCYEKHCFWVRKSRVPTTKPSTIAW